MHVYIDESEMLGDIALGAVVVPDRHRYTVERRLSDLRRRVLREMRTLGYPILDPALAAADRTSRQRTERARLAAGGLPELHAAELWTGDEVFWMERDGTERLFERHLKWLRAALALVGEFDITYRINYLSAEAQALHQSGAPETDLYAYLGSFLTRDVSPKRLRQLQNDVFVRLLFALMQDLDLESQQGGWRCAVTCDRGKRNEIFKSFQTFETLKKYGYWKNMTAPDFQESHENPLIQLADIVTYVHTKANALPEGHRHKEVAVRMYLRYLKRA
ncbi:DUF3800 domain-containing protein, partial [Deinococcus aetherius]